MEPEEMLVGRVIEMVVSVVPMLCEEAEVREQGAQELLQLSRSVTVTVVVAQSEPQVVTVMVDDRE